VSLFGEANLLGRQRADAGPIQNINPPRKELMTMNVLRLRDPLNNLTRWDPFRELDELHNRLGTLFGRTPAGKDGTKETMTLAEWAPLVDIIEDEKEYLIKAELPEIKKEDVRVRVENGVLTISGDRTYEKEDKGRKYHRIERAYGSFERTFTVPDDADATKVNAEFKDGVLRVHLAKDEKAKPRAVEVKVA